VVISSIAVGIWALIFMISFMNAFLISYVKNQVKYETSHIQIHDPDFKKDFELKYIIKNGEEVMVDLLNSGEIRDISPRTISNGMISSPRKATGIVIRGIDIDREASINDIDSFVVEGSYFEEVKRNPIVIGYKTAERLKVKVKSKVVLTFQDIEGNITAGAFRISGIIHSSSPTYNDFTVLVRRKDLNKLLGIGNAFHEIALSMKKGNDELLFAEELKKAHPELLVQSWKELSPELEFFQTSSGAFLWILQIIVMIALIFGIINTMLMSVLERFKELGMLMAIGMNRKKVFSMVMMETFFLALVGAPIGVLISWLTMHYFELNGMDLSAYSEGLEAYGYDNILYPYVTAMEYVQVISGVFLTSIIGAIYPAYKAIKLKPVEALHKFG
jgi:ABC-type lipoprotein release transport system permease subunit